MPVTFVFLTGDVIYYNWKVPEGERHDSALKRNREALAAELKLWEGYLQKVNPDIKYNRIRHMRCLQLREGAVDVDF